MSYRTIEEFAEKKLRELFPQRLVTAGPIDVYETLEQLIDRYGLDFSVVETLPNGVEGRTWPCGKVELSESTIQGVFRSEYRPRFTAIHECGHAWMHAPQIQEVLENGPLMLNRRINIQPFEDPE